MANPGGAYGHVQWNDGGGNFGGHNLFWYNGKLHVGMTGDVGDQYKIQSGDSLYSKNDMFVGRDLYVKERIVSNSIASGAIFPVWEQSSGSWVMTNKTAADYRTAISVYSKAETYSKTEADLRYLAASQITNYYTKSETYGVDNLYTKSQVYTKAEVNAMLTAYCTIVEINSLLENYAQASHVHGITVSPDGAHSHGGTVTTEEAHSHAASCTTPV